MKGRKFIMRVYFSHIQVESCAIWEEKGLCGNDILWNMNSKLCIHYKEHHQVGLLWMCHVHHLRYGDGGQPFVITRKIWTPSLTGDQGRAAGSACPCFRPLFIMRLGSECDYWRMASLPRSDTLASRCRKSDHSRLLVGGQLSSWKHSTLWERQSSCLVKNCQPLDKVQRHWWQNDESAWPGRTVNRMNTYDSDQSINTTFPLPARSSISMPQESSLLNRRTLLHHFWSSW